MAIGNMILVLVTRFIVLFRWTALVYIIGFCELTRVARIIAEREFRAFEVFMFSSFPAVSPDPARYAPFPA